VTAVSLKIKRFSSDFFPNQWWAHRCCGLISSNKLTTSEEHSSSYFAYLIRELNGKYRHLLYKLLLSSPTCYRTIRRGRCLTSSPTSRTRKYSVVNCLRYMIYYTSHIQTNAMLQAGRSRIRFPMRSLGISIDLILPAALWPCGPLGL
jgi:hypothetical protein